MFSWLSRIRCSFLALAGASCAKLVGRFLSRNLQVPAACAAPAAMVRAQAKEEGEVQEEPEAIGEVQEQEGKGGLRNGCVRANGCR